MKHKEGQQRIDIGKKEVKELVEEFDETRAQIEEDADKEIELLKHDYEERLAAERQQTLKIKGENIMMANKFTYIANCWHD
jgi:ElaB/YqjD/DUF883 family membrane-anchored ribosome-binding protein